MKDISKPKETFELLLNIGIIWSSNTIQLLLGPEQMGDGVVS